MSQALRIGVIGGSGWLGGAIAGSLLRAGVVQPDNLAMSYRSRKPELTPEVFWTTDNQALADRSDVILLSVRPADWPALRVDARDKLVLSVMAGITLDALARHHGTGRVVRALPNAAAEVEQSYTPWIAAPGVDEEDRATVRTIFEACGAQDEVRSEGEMDYLTGLSGAGPAFPALLAAAMMRDAIANGLPPQIARRAVNTLLRGTGRLLERRDESPADIVQTFLDYRGTTAAGIEAMQAAGFEQSVATGLAAAFRKSVTMGETS